MLALYLAYNYKSLWRPLNVLHYITLRSLFGFLGAFFLALSLAPWLITMLKQVGEQPISNYILEKHNNKKNTPTMGGLIIILATSIINFLFLDLKNFLVQITLLVFFGFGLVGFFDDYLKVKQKNSKGLSVLWRIFSQILIVAIFMFLFRERYDVAEYIFLPFFKNWFFDLGILYWIWSFLVISGSANGVNLTDGLDGLAIFPVLTTSGCLAICSYLSGNVFFSDYLNIIFLRESGELAVLLSIVSGACLGFLWYNATPAEIFMGDVGSLSLGGLLGAVGIITKQEFTLLIAGGIFVIETVSVIMQVLSFKLRKKRILLMAPIHHHFEKSGIPETKIVIRFWIISVFFAIISLGLLKLR